MYFTLHKLYLKYKRAATASNVPLYSISSATLPFLFFHEQPPSSKAQGMAYPTGQTHRQQFSVMDFRIVPMTGKCVEKALDNMAYSH